MPKNQIVRSRIIRRIALVCLFPLLITCTQIPHLSNGEEAETRIAEGPSAHDVKRIAVHIQESEDLGLALYRNPVTRDLVLKFYGNLTGNKKIAEIILTYANQYEIQPSLAFSLAWAESRYYPAAVNRNQSSIDRGLFQLNSKSFPHLKEEEFFNPAINAKNGLKYLDWCLSAGGNNIVALAMYNAGSNRVEAGGTPRRTLDYIAGILDYMDKLELEFDAYIVEHNVRLVKT